MSFCTNQFPPSGTLLVFVRKVIPSKVLTLSELEGLSIAHGLLLVIYQQSSGHHDKNSTSHTGLDVGCSDLMLYLLEWKSLSDCQIIITFQTLPGPRTTSFSAICAAPCV
jgi:hypothetical protein